MSKSTKSTKPAAPDAKMSWADIHSDDSNSFQKPNLKPKVNALATAASSSTAFPTKTKLTWAAVDHGDGACADDQERRPRRQTRSRGLPVASEDSYAGGPSAEIHENSKIGLNAALKNFGVLLPKEGGVVVEDSNTAGSFLMKRQAKVDTPEPATKRVRGPTSFPVDPVFGGPMPTRASPGQSLKK